MIAEQFGTGRMKEMDLSAGFFLDFGERFDHVYLGVGRDCIYQEIDNSDLVVDNCRLNMSLIFDIDGYRYRAILFNCFRLL